MDYIGKESKESFLAHRQMGSGWFILSDKATNPIADQKAERL